jgi:tight adherence protein B
MSSLAVAWLLFAVAVGLVLAGVWQIYRARAETAAIAARTTFDPPQSRRRDLLRDLDRRLRATRYGDDLQQRLLSAGIDARPIDFVLMALAVVLAALVVGSAILASWAAVLLAIGAYRACIWWVDRKRAQRREEMIGQLPELARTISNGVSAGLSTQAALELAARELRPPISDELATVVAEARVGQSLTDALERLRKRVPSRELGVLVSTIVIQQRAGGDSVRALQDMSQTLEDRKDLIREVRTVMAGSVFSGWVVAALGLLTLVGLNLLQPGLLETMTSDFVGIAALVFSISVYAVGLFLIHRFTRVET